MLTIKNEHSVRALLRALISAKFSAKPADRDVPASPFVAELAREAAELLERIETEREGAAAKERWTTWREFRPDRPEWKIALTYATESFSGKWHTWPAEQRGAVLKDLIAPFVMDETITLIFINELNSLIQ